MVIAKVKFSDEVYSKIQKDWNLRYEDIINYYEDSSFEYEKVWMKAGDFKSYLINELSNG